MTEWTNIRLEMGYIMHLDHRLENARVFQIQHRYAVEARNKINLGIAELLDAGPDDGAALQQLVERRANVILEMERLEDILRIRNFTGMTVQRRMLMEELIDHLNALQVNGWAVVMQIADMTALVEMRDVGGLRVLFAVGLTVTQAMMQYLSRIAANGLGIQDLSINRLYEINGQNVRTLSVRAAARKGFPPRSQAIARLRA